MVSAGRVYLQCYKHPPQNVQLARCYETSKILMYYIQSVEKCGNVKKECLAINLSVALRLRKQYWTYYCTTFFTCFPNEQVLRPIIHDPSQISSKLISTKRVCFNSRHYRISIYSFEEPLGARLVLAPRPSEGVLLALRVPGVKDMHLNS